MNKEFYFSRNTALINYTKKYCVTVDELLASEGFNAFLDLFFAHIEKEKHDMYQWLTFKSSVEEAKKEVNDAVRGLLYEKPRKFSNKDSHIKIFDNKLTQLFRALHGLL